MYAPQFQPPPPHYSMPFNFLYRTSSKPHVFYYSPRHGASFVKPQLPTSRNAFYPYVVPLQYSHASSRGVGTEFPSPHGGYAAPPEHVSGFDYAHARLSRASYRNLEASFVAVSSVRQHLGRLSRSQLRLRLQLRLRKRRRIRI